MSVKEASDEKVQEMLDAVNARKHVPELYAPPGKETEPLGRRFRRLTREMMVDDKIQALIRARVEAELTGQTEGCPVTTTLMRIAATTPTGNRTKSREGSWQAPAIHVHLSKMTDEELRAFSERGVRPSRKSLGERIIDAEEVQEREAEGASGSATPEAAAGAS